MRKRELEYLLGVNVAVSILFLFFMVPLVGLQCVIVVFPGQSSSLTFWSMTGLKLALKVCRFEHIWIRENFVVTEHLCHVRTSVNPSLNLRYITNKQIRNRHYIDKR